MAGLTKLDLWECTAFPAADLAYLAGKPIQDLGFRIQTRHYAEIVKHRLPLTRLSTQLADVEGLLALAEARTPLEHLEFHFTRDSPEQFWRCMVAFPLRSLVALTELVVTPPDQPGVCAFLASCRTLQSIGTLRVTSSGQAKLLAECLRGRAVSLQVAMALGHEPPADVLEALAALRVDWLRITCSPLRDRLDLAALSRFTALTDLDVRHASSSLLAAVLARPLPLRRLVCGPARCSGEELVALCRRVTTLEELDLEHVDESSVAAAASDLVCSGAVRVLCP